MWQLRPVRKKTRESWCSSLSRKGLANSMEVGNMTTRCSILGKGFAAIAVFATIAGLATRTQAQTATPPLKLLQTIPLPGIEGAQDHMDLDVQGQRLFIPAE